MKKNKIFRALLVASIAGCFLSFGTNAAAQVTGDLVEPDVLLLMDSSSSMGWRDNDDPDDLLISREWAKEACEANLSTNDGKTAWQKTLDAFLGSIDGDTYKCSVENDKARPSLHAVPPALVDNFLTDDNSDGVPDNISEFCDESDVPHLRAVSCPENTENPGNPYWIESPSGQYQCIDTSVPGDIELVNGRYCMKDDIHTVDGIDTCLNLHPASTSRQANGILDRYESTVRFGFMTYDEKPSCNSDTCTDHGKAWDYGLCRDWKSENWIENVQYTQWNAGARADETGAVGGLVRIRSNIEQSNSEVRTALETMEPLFCSYLGPLLDDAGYYFSEDSAVLPNADTISGEDTYYRCRPKIVILVTDGHLQSTFEFAPGTCGGAELDWKPSPHSTETNCGGTPDSTLCPWRSSFEEAAEMYDLGEDILGELPPASTSAKPDQPILLVVIGLNVKDIDCSDPEQNVDCFEYSSEYYETRHCWDGLPACEGTTLPDGGVEENTCLMTPREFLNEVACQGWPYNPEVSYMGHEEDYYHPSWYPDESGICEPQGYTGDPDAYNCRYNERALFVSSGEQLRTVMNLILNDLSSTTTTRTDLVAYNIPGASGAENTAVQYEFRTGYTKGEGAWKGVLTRADWGCGESGVQALEYQDVAAALESQSGRTFYGMSVADQEGVLDDNAYATQLTNQNIVQWITQTLPDFATTSLDSNSFTDCDFGISSEIGEIPCDNYILKNEVLEFLQNGGLADIYNSTPSVLGQPVNWSNSSSYQQFIEENSDADGRKSYLFVGTNDGLLHAFEIDAMGTEADSERWGYMPRSMIKQVREHFPMPPIIIDGETYSLGDDIESGIYDQMFLLDGSPMARDVLMARDLEELGTETGDQWRSIVFGGVGKGARTYYALDVTDSVKAGTGATVSPRVLWEISPGENLFGNNDADNKVYINKMGYPISRPALAYVSEIDLTMQMQLAAAILPGGWKSDAEENTGVYIVRLGDGHVIRYLEPSYAADEDSGMCGDTTVGLAYEDGKLLEFAQLIGEPVVLEGTMANRRARNAFIGDDHGRIWMIDMEEEDPTKWCLRLYFDTMVAWHFPYEECWPRTGETPVSSCTPSPSTCFHTDCCATADGQPVVPATKCATDQDFTRNMSGPRVLMLGAPTIAKNEDNEPVMVFGTGQYDELSTWNRNRIFSITDKINEQGKHYAQINWWVGDVGLEKGDTTFPVFDTNFPSSMGTYQAWLSAIEEEMEATKIVSRTDWAGAEGDPKYLFNVGEKMIGRPTIFDNVAYFTTFAPIEDPTNTTDACLAGTSRIWAVDFNAKVCVDPEDTTCDYIPSDFEDPEDTRIGQFVEDDKYRLFRNYSRSLLSGVQVIRRPSCDDMDATVFELVAQKSTSTESLGGSLPSARAVDVVRVNIDKNATITVSKVRFDSWQIVFE